MGDCTHSKGEMALFLRHQVHPPQQVFLKRCKGMQLMITSKQPVANRDDLMESA